MTQKSYTVADQDGASFLVTINEILEAVATGNSGATAPAETHPGLIWLDTATNKIKRRNQADDGWVILGDLDEEYMGLLSRAGGAMNGVLQLKKSTDIASGATTDLGTADGNSVTVTHSSGTVAITSLGGASSLQAGTVMDVSFSISGGTLSLTHNATSMFIPGGSNLPLADKDKLRVRKTSDSSANWEVIGVTKADGTPIVNTPVLMGFIAGLTMSTAGSSSTMSIASGQAADSTTSSTLALASALSKTTSSWAVGSGNGGLDTGAIANNTWYHFYLIRRPDTGVVDLVFSTNASAPTLPANYTQYRRIGSGKTNGSAQWIKFLQIGNRFSWDTPVLDVDISNESNTGTLRTLSIPLGVKTEAIFNAYQDPTGTSVEVYFSDPDVADVAPSRTAAPLSQLSARTSSGIPLVTAQIRCFSNTSSQIRTRHSSGSASNAFRIATVGWIDSRGAN